MMTTDAATIAVDPDHPGAFGVWTRAESVRLVDDFGYGRAARQAW